MNNSNEKCSGKGNPFPEPVNHFDSITVTNSWCIIAANLAIIPGVIVFNLLVIASVYRAATLRRRITNLLLAYLATTDLLVGLVVQPLLIASLICDKYPGYKSTLLNYISFCLLLTLTLSSILHLDVIAVDRYIAVKHALRYDAIVTPRRIRWAVVATWVVSAALVLPFLIDNNYHFEFFAICLCFMFLFIFMIFYCYVSLYRESLRHKRMIHSQFADSPQNAASDIDFKATKTTAMIVGSVLLTFGVFVFGSVVLKVLGVSSELFFNCFPWFCYIITLNSLLNPLIYFWRSPVLRQVARGLLRFH